MLLAVAVPLVIVAASGSGDGGGGSKLPSLRVEPSPGVPGEIVVYVEDVSLNTAAAAGEARSVTVECRNPEDEVVFSLSYPWPFTDTDNGTLDPHQHLTLNEATVDRVASCRLASRASRSRPSCPAASAAPGA